MQKIFTSGYWIVLDEILKYIYTPPDFLKFSLINKTCADFARFRSLTWRRRHGVWYIYRSTPNGSYFTPHSDIRSAFDQSFNLWKRTWKIQTKLMYPKTDPATGNIDFDNAVDLQDCLFYKNTHNEIEHRVSHFGDVWDRECYSDSDIPEFIDDDLDPYQLWEFYIHPLERTDSSVGRVEAFDETHLI